MKRRQVKFVGLLMVAGLALCIGAVATQRMVEGEREVTLAEVPELVKAAILAQAQGNTINEIEVEVENGQQVYEAEVIVNGREVDIRVAADGTVLGEETDDEDGDDDDEADDDDEDEDERDVRVSLGELPPAVQAVLTSLNGEIRELERETEDGREQYAADVVIDGQLFDVEIAPDGTLLKKEVEDQDDDE